MSGQLLSLREAAAYLGRHPEWVRRYTAEGRLPARRIGRRWWFTRPELDRWLQGEDPTIQVVAPAPEPLVLRPIRRRRRGGHG